jgi:formate dehydrogenase gamma subunit
MKRTCAALVIAALAALALGAPRAQEEQAVSSDECAACHAGTDLPGGAIPDSLTGSAHDGLSCFDCHAPFSELPHADQMPGVDCGACHADVVEIYQQHGRGKVGESAYIPDCAGCHGSHRILGHAKPQSSVNPLNLPGTCGRCHEDSTLIANLNIKFKHPIRVYRGSTHGSATAGGVQQAASCNDCHSTGGTAHMILPPGDSRSTINHFNIPHTCGRCHTTIAKEYWEGIHGQLTANGETDAPICTHCHGEHGILPVNDPRSPVSPARVAEATCSPCHESAALNEKYDLPTGRLQTFIDSYHGLKSKAGDKLVANCASCHGAHRILPASDPTSSINPANLSATCGNCHPNITPSIARTPIHATATGRYQGWPRLVQIIYTLAIALIIGAMTLHWLIDLFRQIRNVMRERQVTRMDADEVIQHTVLALAFTVLVLTGFALRFYDAWWSTLLFGREGGFEMRGAIHRAAGIVLLLASLWHLGFLATRRGRVFLHDMWPRKEDFSHFFQMIRYNLGRSDFHPEMGRFTYIEKAEYWALVWGTVVMGITGLFLWFDNVAVRFFHKGLLDVLLVIHYYEAWLAFLAILIWHMYATVFNPRVYPMNPSWLTGQMPERMFTSEHATALAASNIDEADIEDATRRAASPQPPGEEPPSEAQSPQPPQPGSPGSGPESA